MDEIYRRDPCLGTRKIVIVLGRDHGLEVNRKRVPRLREEMGLWTIFRGPRTSVAKSTHMKFPYLLRERVVTAPNQVWCSDITYVQMLSASSSESSSAARIAVAKFLASPLEASSVLDSRAAAAACASKGVASFSETCGAFTATIGGTESPRIHQPTVPLTSRQAEAASIVRSASERVIRVQRSRGLISSKGGGCAV